MKKYEITKEQVLELADLGYENKLKKWFPEVFKTELEVGKWYKSNYPLLIFIEQIHHSYLVGYGFNSIQEFKTGNFCRRLDDKHKVDYKNFNFIEATNEEIFEALKNEAIKRGFGKKNVYFIDCLSRNFISTGKFSFYNSKVENNGITNGANGWIFRDGIWATIIPTLTKKEAEEKLNCKII